MLSRLALVIALSLPLVAAPAVLGNDVAEAASTKKKKKKSYKRSDFTPEQREKLMEYARQQCRKKYGATSRLMRIDYSTARFWCWTG